MIFIEHGKAGKSTIFPSEPAPDARPRALQGRGHGDIIELFLTVPAPGQAGDSHVLTSAPPAKAADRKAMHGMPAYPSDEFRIWLSRMTTPPDPW